MFGIEQLKDFIEGKFGVAVELNVVGAETVTVLLCHEELDEELISEDVLQILPNQFYFTHIFTMRSQSGLLELP